MYPGSDLIVLLAIALGFSLLHGYAYAVIGATAPRAGADYVLGSRVLSAPLAFASSFTFVLFSGLLAGSLIASLPKTVIPTALRTFALVSGQDLGSLVADIASQQWVVAIGTIGVVLAFATSLLKPYQLKIVLLVGLVLGLLAWGIIFFQLAGAEPGSFEGIWNSAMGAGNFTEHLESAQKLGLQATPPGQTLPYAGLLMGFWVLFGYFSPTFFAGEVKDPGKTLLSSSWSALLICGGIFLAAVWLVQRAIPMDFIAAESYLSQSGLFDATAMPYITFYAALLYPSPPLVAFTGIVWVYLTFCMAVAFFFFTSRIVLAWAKDNILPGGMGVLHPTRRAPVLALFFIAMLALLGVMDASQSAPLLSYISYALIAVVCMLVPLIALVIFPFTRQKWFASAPRLVRLKLGPIPLISVVALITTLYLIWLVISHFLYPGNSLPPSWVELTAFVVFFGGGILVYSNRKESLRQKGIELGDAFKDLPQDD